ncbi:MAG: hypothetical protein ACE15F_07070 [bacterium]
MIPHRLLSFCILFASASPVWSGVNVVRSMPDFYQPGQTVEITLEVSVSGTGPTGLIVEEAVPAGWTLAAATPPQSSLKEGKIGWVLFDAAGVKQQILVYSLSVPVSESGIKTFSGTAKFLDSGTQQILSIGGDSILSSTALPTPVPTPPPGGAVEVERILPDGYKPGESVRITLEITIGGGGPVGLIVEEQIPSGWSLVSAQPQASSQQTGRIGWVLFDAVGVSSQVIIYTLSVPQGESGEKPFLGTVKYLEGTMQRTLTIGGDAWLSSSEIAPPPITPTPTPAVGPPPVVPSYRNTLDRGNMDENEVQVIAGTFAVLQPALTDITSVLPAGGEALGTGGNALRFIVQPGQGSLLLFGTSHPVAADTKALTRVCVWSNNPSAQIFVGLIETDANGNLTGSDLGMDQLMQSSVMTKAWRRITALHECQSGFVVPFVQVVGNIMSSEVYIDNVEVYIIQKDAIYSGEFLGVDR